MDFRTAIAALMAADERGDDEEARRLAIELALAAADLLQRAITALEKIAARP